MQEVTIKPRDPSRFAAVIGEERTDELLATADAASAFLDGRRVVNVNSTAAGGGVAEMLHVLLGFTRGVGIDARWLVIEADSRFFELTKRLHNRLYGGNGDGGPLDEAEHDVYRTALEANAVELAAAVRPGDVVVLHDPQTAGLAEHAKQFDCRVVWRCHVGIDEPNEHSEQAWGFLRPYLEPHVDHYVFTDRKFPPPWVPTDRYTTIWPSIDPFSPKNQDLSDHQVEAILTHVGILAGRSGDRTFVRTDGTAGRVERVCDVDRTGPAAPVKSPMIVQVSRWDTMKDMEGVMEAFARHVDSDTQLVLAGPAVSAVSDDPEGGQVLENCRNTWRRLPDSVRSRVQLVCLPMHDLEENAAIVNALQHHATIVTQKSLAEGFGLTIAEAMLKGRPVIASAVGGITDQVIDGETGLLVRDPLDLQEFGNAVCRVLGDGDLRRRLGAAARERAIATHLGDTHLQKWVEVIAAVLAREG